MTPGDWAALDRTGFAAMRALLCVVWQSSILLAAAGLLAWALRRRKASVRHAVWAAALVIAPLLPLLGWVASSARTPQVRIPVMPAYAPPEQPAEEIATAAPIEVPAPAGDWSRPPTGEPAGPPAEGAATAPPAEESDPLAPAAAPAPAPTPAKAKTSILAYPWALGLLAYAAGVTVFVALVLAGRFRLHRWARTGRPVLEPRVLAAFRAAAARLAPTGMSRASRRSPPRSPRCDGRSGRRRFFDSRPLTTLLKKSRADSGTCCSTASAGRPDRRPKRQESSYEKAGRRIPPSR